MSRSKRKTPKGGITTAESEKKEKQDANRKLRRAVKQVMKIDTEKELPKLREISNVWSFSKDGKRYYSGMTEKDLRK